MRPRPDVDTPPRQAPSETGEAPSEAQGRGKDRSVEDEGRRHGGSQGSGTDPLVALCPPEAVGGERRIDRERRGEAGTVSAEYEGGGDDVREDVEPNGRLQRQQQPEKLLRLRARVREECQSEREQRQADQRLRQGGVRQSRCERGKRRWQQRSS